MIDNVEGVRVLYETISLDLFLGAHFYFLCKTANSNVVGPCLMQVHFTCPICNCLTLLYDHAAP